VAKELLKGKRVHVVNAEKALISGRKEAVFDHYKAWLRARTLTSPRKGPFHYRYPEDILRRTIRGMLPYDKPRGREAYKRLRVHRGIPETLAGREATKVAHASVRRLKTRRRVRLLDLSRHLGAKV
jgi:ribosomal protein uL13